MTEKAENMPGVGALFGGGPFPDSAGKLRNRIVMVFSVIAHKQTPGAGVRNVVEGEISPGTFDHLCVLAHFDPHGKIDDYVIQYMEELLQAGRETVLVSTADTLDSQSIKKAAPLCRSIILRENSGYDFGSWKTGLQHVQGLADYQSLLLANDSVYGPLCSLRDVFDRMKGRGLDFWGITDSWAPLYHIQSYFLVFENRLINSSFFRQFWNRLPSFRYKQLVIWGCEVWLSRSLLRSGFRIGALCEYGELRRRHPSQVRDAETLLFLRWPRNPTHYFWRRLIEDHGCPFIKIELLRDNPKDIDVDQWPQLIEQHTEYEPDLIRDHLKRLRQTKNIGPTITGKMASPLQGGDGQ